MTSVSVISSDPKNSPHCYQYHESLNIVPDQTRQRLRPQRGPEGAMLLAKPKEESSMTSVSVSLSSGP